jgi:hypothetical protein
LWTITRLRLKQDRRGVSNIIVVVLSLVIIVAIVANIVLWSYEMNQLDWEKMKEDTSITNVERISRSSWFVAQSEYTVNTGSLVNGTYQDTQTVNNVYETFQEGLAGSQLETLRPNAVGQYAELGTVYPGGTAHWDACDEDPPDDDASYVQTSTSSWRSEAYSIQDSSASGNINWIHVYVRARKTSTADISIRTLIRTNSTDYESSDISLTTSYQNSYTQYNTNPFTGQPWTWSEIDSLQAGASAKSLGSTHVRMTAVWVVVNHTSTNYTLDMNGAFALDVSTYPLDYIQTVEIQLKYRANATDENWYLKAYNWTAAAYSNSGFNNTSGHTPTTGWDIHAVNLTDKWRSYVSDSGTIYVKLQDNQADANQTTIDIDFLGVRVKIDGTRFTFENKGALTSHLVSLWIINSTNHQHFDINVFVNSAETTTYLRADISLPESQYTVKVVTERGNTAVYSGS